MKLISIVTQMEAAGAQRIAYLLHEGFQVEGHSSKLVFLYTKRPAYEGLAGVSSLLNHQPSALDYGRIALKLADLLRTEKPDVLITHTHYANILGQSVAMLCGIGKRIAVNHSPDSIYSRGARIADSILGSSGVYSKIVAVSEAVSVSLAKYPSPYRTRITVINNGISVSARQINRDVIKVRFGIPLESPLLVNVGRLNVVKNQSLLIRTLTYLPNAHLVIIGEGELRDDLLSLAKYLHVADRLHLAGELPSADVNTIVGSSDVFVFPSLAEAMGLALAEAMLLRRPVVASDLPVFADLLGDGGILASAQNASAWAEAIQYVLSNPCLARSLGKRAQQIAGRYSPGRMASKYLALMST